MARFKTLGMQNGDNDIFFLRCFRKKEILKNAVSGSRCMDSSLCIDYPVERGKITVILFGSMLSNLKGH